MSPSLQWRRSRNSNLVSDLEPVFLPPSVGWPLRTKCRLGGGALGAEASAGVTHWGGSPGGTCKSLWDVLGS